MVHNRESTLGSIVDLYGTHDGTATSPQLETQDEQEEELYEQGEHPAALVHERIRNISGGSKHSIRGYSNGDSNGRSTEDLDINTVSLAPPIGSTHIPFPSNHTSKDPYSSHHQTASSSSYHQKQHSTSSSSIGDQIGSGGGRLNLNVRAGINGRYNASAVSFSSVRHPGEEEDAYHVRSTYARLEVQGVYGDGWDEGIERTRERAILRRRNSDPPTQKGDQLDAKERQALSRVDRYGFFDQALKARQESRLALLPVKPFKSIPKLPKAPPKSTSAPSNGPSTSQEEEATNLPLNVVEKLSANSVRRAKEKEKQRVGKWETMLNISERDGGMNISRWTWEQKGKGVKLPERVYKGIPDRWRAAAWAAMAETRIRGGPSMGQLDEIYRKNLDLNSTYDVQIDLDVPRTISGHILFHTRYGHGQRSLFHVLHCFSMHCGECGYCQGMGPIAATLLCYLDAPRVFAMMVRIHDVYQMHSIFIHGFPGLLECFYLQERLIELIMPDVYVSLRDNMIASSSYATKWYITLFANTVPFQTQLRIWDAFFLDGLDTLIVASVGILWAHRGSIGSPKANFETILSSLSSFYIPEDEDAYLRWIRKILNSTGVRERMQGWRRDWKGLVERKEDGKALL